MYKFLCENKEYEPFQYVETKTFQPVDISTTPKEMKLFVNDLFHYDHDTKQHHLVHSNFRVNKWNPGILDLTMTHGKENNKFLYLCKPDDKRIPFFLIPYYQKQGFDKSVQKLYITFEFKHWNHARPYGTMTQNLGNIVILNHYYEYILYCKSLNVSIQPFTKEVKQKLQSKNCQQWIQTIREKNNIHERNKQDHYIFTIDSKEAVDFDDAISYNEKEHKVSIYITNVALIMDELSLWDAFTNRVSNIYLPDKRRSMLPSLLIDSLCSLKQKESKLCYVLDLYYNEDNSLRDYTFDLCNAYIHKNVFYEELETFEKTKHLQPIMKIFNVKRSKQLITRLMLLFNHYVAKGLQEKKVGIFKTLNQKEESCITKEHIPQDVYERISIFKTNASNYSVYHEDLVYKSIIHKDIDVYVQSTSPIRRLVDLLNNIVFIHALTSHTMSTKAQDFYDYWTTSSNMEHINISSRSIRKIQSKCFIYQKYEQNRVQGKEVHYEGYVFDKVYKEGDGKYQYMVYISSLGLITYITLIEDLANYSKHLFSLYVFMNEENDKKKVKLQLCYECKEMIQ